MVVDINCSVLWKTVSSRPSSSRPWFKHSAINADLESLEHSPARLTLKRLCGQPNDGKKNYKSDRTEKRARIFVFKVVVLVTTPTPTTSMHLLKYRWHFMFFQFFSCSGFQIKARSCVQWYHFNNRNTRGISYSQWNWLLQIHSSKHQKETTYPRRLNAADPSFVLEAIQWKLLPNFVSYCFVEVMSPKPATV